MEEEKRPLADDFEKVRLEMAAAEEQSAKGEGDGEEDEDDDEDLFGFIWKNESALQREFPVEIPGGATKMLRITQNLAGPGFSLQ